MIFQGQDCSDCRAISVKPVFGQHVHRSVFVFSNTIIEFSLVFRAVFRVVIGTLINWLFGFLLTQFLFYPSIHFWNSTNFEKVGCNGSLKTTVNFTSGNQFSVSFFLHISMTLFPQTLPRPSSFNHFINNALWVGFYKTDNISEDIKVRNLLIACGARRLLLPDSTTNRCTGKQIALLPISFFPR